MNSQIDPLSQMSAGMLNAIAMAGSNNSGAMGATPASAGYPGGIGASLSMAPPGSPAKSFAQQLGQQLGPLPQQPPQAFNNLQALTSQLQGNTKPTLYTLSITMCTTFNSQKEYFR